MPGLVVICAVGLTPNHIGSDTPHLQALADAGGMQPLTPSLPAVTTTAQTTMLTGQDPSAHGIVGNGWYFRELGEVWLWRQSERLIDAPLLWHGASVDGRPLRVLKHFWWYAMNTSVTATVTPRPAYHADGSKSPDIYTWPPELHHAITNSHGAFPLFQFWGPTANIASTKWIAESFATAHQHSSPDLSLVYLPHLDYDLQRFGPSGPHLAQNLADLDNCVGSVVAHAKAAGDQVLVVSEYGIEAVNHAVPINRCLREAGLLAVQTNPTGELLDPGASRAFAVVDHQLAHVYCADDAAVTTAAAALQALPGIERCYVGSERAELGLEHARSGEIIALAAPGAWFLYDYWLDAAKRPDFADLVEIHKKPGYDPRELAFGPSGKRRAGIGLLRKKLGLRYRMAAIGQDPSVVRGSHGRLPSEPGDGPVVIAPNADALKTVSHQRDIAGLIAGLLA